MSIKAKVTIFTIFICGFAYLCWYAYYTQVDNSLEKDLLLIKAQQDIKSKPENPGGMEVLNQDKAIYKEMLTDNNSEQNVKIVNNNETPVSKKQIVGLINKQIKNENTTDTNNLADTKISDKTKQNNKKYLYSVRVAKLKEKKFFKRGKEFFQKKYGKILKSSEAELVIKNGEYYIHFSHIPSKEEAKQICSVLIESGNKCKLFQK